MRDKGFRSLLFVGLIVMIVFRSLGVGLAESETLTWEEKASMSVGRNNFGCVEIDGKIYAIGGTTSEGDHSTSVEMYDPSANTWQSKASMNIGRRQFGATTYNGKIYIFGGSGSNIYDSFLNSVEEYNPETDSWTIKSNMPSKIELSKAICVNDKIFVFGGRSSSTVYSQEVLMYDPVNDTWESKTSAPIGLIEFGLTNVGSKIYIIGGQISTSPFMTNTVNIYNSATDTWEVGTQMLSATTAHEAVTYNNDIYSLFGSNRDTGGKEIEKYNLTSSNWESISLNSPYNTIRFGSVLIGNNIYIIGGKVNDNGSYRVSNNVIMLSLSDIQTQIPLNLTATAGNAQVTLNWDAVEDADSYTLKRSTTSGDPYTVIADGLTSTTYTDTALTNGTTYYYVVTAIKSGTESENSNEASATPVEPIIPVTNRALLSITMENSLVKEYDMAMTEVEEFIEWYNSTSGSKLYTINKSCNMGPFLNRKDYLVKDMIVCFEVMEYVSGN